MREVSSDAHPSTDAVGDGPLALRIQSRGHGPKTNTAADFGDVGPVGGQDGLVKVAKIDLDLAVDATPGTVRPIRVCPSLMSAS